MTTTRITRAANLRKGDIVHTGRRGRRAVERILFQPDLVSIEWDTGNTGDYDPDREFQVILDA